MAGTLHGARGPQPPSARLPLRPQSRQDDEAHAGGAGGEGDVNTGRFKPDKGFSGADYGKGGEGGAVQVRPRQDTARAREAAAVGQGGGPGRRAREAAAALPARCMPAHPAAMVSCCCWSCCVGSPPCVDSPTPPAPPAV